MQIPFAVLICVLAAALAPWIFLVAAGAWVVWQVVKEEPAEAVLSPQAR